MTAPHDPTPRKRRTVFMTAGLSASAAVIAASLSMAQAASADEDADPGSSETITQQR